MMTEVGYQIWTDGACRGNPGPGGWAYIVRAHDGSEDVCYDHDASTTNNRMELTAALEALRSIPKGSRATLFSDSQYVVKGMSEWIPGWQRRNWRKSDGKPVLNDDIWKQLVAVDETREIHWEWVEGHAGQEQNERCDALANRAIDEAC